MLNLLTYFICIFLLFSSLFLVTIYAFPLILPYIFPFFFFLFPVCFILLPFGTDIRSAFCECRKKSASCYYIIKTCIRKKNRLFCENSKISTLVQLKAVTYLFACCKLSRLILKAFPRICRRWQYHTHRRKSKTKIRYFKNNSFARRQRELTTYFHMTQDRLFQYDRNVTVGGIRFLCSQYRSQEL